MKLKHRDKVTWADLPLIELAFWVSVKAERECRYEFSFGLIEPLLWEGTQFHRRLNHIEHRRERARGWERLQKKIESYEIVGVIDSYEGKPSVPVFSWQAQADHAQGGMWKIHSMVVGPWERSQLERLLREVRPPKDGAPSGSGLKGTASLALDLVPGVGALKSAAQVVTGTDLLTGAPVSRGLEAVGIVAGLIPGGKALLKGGAKASENLGETGMKQAQQRTGQVPDERFAKRYHGPDGMTRDKDGKLCEWECKGRADGSVGVAKHKDGKKQISEKANRKYAEKMLGKQEHGKIGKLPGPKIGGPYNSNEMELYQEIADNFGQKRHISSHTNTTTGRVEVFERDGKGNLGKKLDDFTLDNFENVKQRILKEVGE